MELAHPSLPRGPSPALPPANPSSCPCSPLRALLCALPLWVSGCQPQSHPSFLLLSKTPRVVPGPSSASLLLVLGFHSGWKGKVANWLIPSLEHEPSLLPSQSQGLTNPHPMTLKQAPK